MGETSAIQWTQRTWNPWQGCAKVSEGCANCYMFRDKRRYGQDPETVVRSSAQTFNAPMKWQREAAAAGRTDLVFTCSWSDWFIRDADAWRPEAWEIIKRCPNLVFQILTKRHGRIAKGLPADWGTGYPNVWLGVSAEDQATWDARTRELREVPARVRFVSVEPMLGAIDPTMRAGEHLPPCPQSEHNRGTWASLPCDCWPHRLGIGWVILGGESGGREARPTDPAWVRTFLAACSDGVAWTPRPFVKQLGSVWAREHKARDSHGGDMAEWPADLRVREFPEGAS